MLVKHELEKIMTRLLEENYAQMQLEGFDLTLRITDQTSKLSLSTPVYFGGNYIPKSVRNCLSTALSSAGMRLKTYLHIDEMEYTVSLNYLGILTTLSQEELRDLLEEFTEQAHEWRNFLDEHDKNDLIYIHSKR